MSSKKADKFYWSMINNIKKNKLLRRIGNRLKNILYKTDNTQIISPEMPVPELGRGYFDYLEYSQGTLSITGWMFLPDRPFDGFRVQINGISVGMGHQVLREDVQNVFPFFETARRSGFADSA